MALLLSPLLTNLKRTRDVVRFLKRLSSPDRTKKELLAEWFQDHPRAGINPGDIGDLLREGLDLDEALDLLRKIGRRAGYNDLLGSPGQRQIG